MILRRLFLIVGILLTIISMTYGMMELVPGNVLIGERNVGGEAFARKQQQYDEKHNFKLYLSNIVKGDLGTSYVQNERQVTDIIGPAIPVSFTLGGMAIVLAVVTGITAGIIAAHKRNQTSDRVAMFLALVGLSIPAFVLGPILQLTFGLELNWLSIGGWWHPMRSVPSGNWTNIVLPAITLSAIPAATIARLTRSSMLEALNQDYMKTALAKGVSQFQAVIKHGLRNAILPVLSYIGPASAAVLMGSIVVEKVFRIPGLGEHFINGSINRDYEVVLGVVILYSTLLLVFNLIIDVLYTKVDPRITLE